MLEMKKNTRSKIAAIAASALAFGAVFGLLHRTAPQVADAQPAPLAVAASEQQAAATPAATTRATQAQTVPSRTANTTTRVS